MISKFGYEFVYKIKKKIKYVNNMMWSTDLGGDIKNSDEFIGIGCNMDGIFKDEKVFMEY